MRDYHLSILGLDPTATTGDIKSAYRELSKKYHPDVSKSPDAQEKFILIKEAYEYLTTTPKYETREPTDYFNEELRERERWRAEHRRKSREKEIENQRLQLELIVKILTYAKPVVVLIIVLNLLFATDFLLPLRDHKQTIKGVGQVYESSSNYYGRKNHKYRYDEMYFDDFTMRFDRGEIILMDHYEKAVVQATTIFSKPMYVVITVDGRDQRYRQIYNIYYVFGYLIPFMVVLGLLFFRLKPPMQRLNVSIVLFVFSMIQLLLLFR